MEIINTEKAPAAIGPYSQGYKVGNIIYTSGQLPIDTQTNEMPQSIEEQAQKSCENVKQVLQAGGSSLEKVVKTTCYLSDMKYFEAFNQIYSEYFVSKPARSCFAVKQLPKNALCEIEAVAVVN